MNWGECEWTARDVRPRRAEADGLWWCAECFRAVDRGWEHDPGCPVAITEPPPGFPAVPRSRLAVRLVEQHREDA